ncbi:MAG: DEAD/DEAH box helicase, partial [Myxococcota bacterium]
LWSLMRLCEPTLLGAWKSFNDRFAKPIQNGDAERRADLGRLIRPFLLRRTKSQVAQDLPECELIQVPIQLDSRERELYEGIRAHAVSHLLGNAEHALGQERKRFEVLGALTRLRLATCHPALVGGERNAPSAKLNRLSEMCEELASVGRSALVFSQFTSFLALVRSAMEEAKLTYLYLDGSTPGAERAKRVERFQAGAAPFFLISLKAGGVGLNLTRADTVIHLDPWWNPAVEQQATDRAHRIGQKKHVTVFRFFARDTVEEKVMRLQEHKRELVSSLLEGHAPGSTPDFEQLLELLGGQT